MGGSAGPADLARGIAKTATHIDSALEAEVWASHMLGMFAAQRFDLPFPEALDTDPVLMYGQPLLRQLARLDDPGAAIAIAAISELDEGELGLQAKELLDSGNLWRRLPARSIRSPRRCGSGARRGL